MATNPFTLKKVDIVSLSSRHIDTIDTNETINEIVTIPDEDDADLLEVLLHDEEQMISGEGGHKDTQSTTLISENEHKPYDSDEDLLDELLGSDCEEQETKKTIIQAETPQASFPTSSFPSFTRSGISSASHKVESSKGTFSGVSAINGPSAIEEDDDNSPLPFAGKPFIVEPRTKLRFAPSNQRSVQRFLTSDYEALSTKLSPFLDIPVANHKAVGTEKLSLTIVGVLVAKYYPKGHGASINKTEERDIGSVSYGIIKLWNGKGNSLHVGENSSNPNIATITVSGAAFHSTFSRLLPSTLVIVINPQLPTKAKKTGEAESAPSGPPIFKASSFGSVVLAGRAIDCKACCAQLGSNTRKGNTANESKNCSVLVNTVVSQTCPYHSAGAASKAYSTAISSIKGTASATTTTMPNKGMSTLIANGNSTITAKGLYSIQVPASLTGIGKKPPAISNSNTTLKQSISDQAMAVLGLGALNIELPKTKLVGKALAPYPQPTRSNAESLDSSIDGNFLCTKGFKLVSQAPSTSNHNAAMAQLLRHRMAPQISVIRTELINQPKASGDADAIKCPRGALLLAAAVDAQSKEKMRQKLEEAKQMASMVATASKRQRETLDIVSEPRPAANKVIAVSKISDCGPSSFFVHSTPAGLPSGIKVLLPTTLSKVSAFSPMAGNNGLASANRRGVGPAAVQSAVLQQSHSSFVSTVLKAAGGASADIVALAKASSSMHAAGLESADWDRKMESVDKVIRVEKALETLDNVLEVPGVQCFHCFDCDAFHSTSLDSCKARHHTVEAAVATRRFYECLVCQKFRMNVLEAPTPETNKSEAQYSSITTGAAATTNGKVTAKRSSKVLDRDCPVCKQRGVWRKCSAAPVEKDIFS